MKVVTERREAMAEVVEVAMVDSPVMIRAASIDTKLVVDGSSQPPRSRTGRSHCLAMREWNS